MRSSIPLVACVLALLKTAAAVDAPQVTTRNGTYQGRHLQEWDQDAFLGIPFAQPPTGPLRWKWPQSINTSFDGVRDASNYGYSCMQYTGNFNMSEDCLNLNVIRPAGEHKKKLPVLVWIFGGGLYTGSIADPQYNLSGIVKVSQDMGQPVIAVDMNYRLNMYGFLQTPQILAEGSSNAGLLDQRLALRWIQENIEAFGGDPSRVILWGESAGAQSIAYHLFSYGGRNDGLFHGAIMESGGPTGAQVQTLPYYTVPVANLSSAVGCSAAKDQLACLRSVPSDKLYAAHPSQVWNPLVDGDFLTAYPSQLMRDNQFIKVPLLTGTNTDEGSSFSISGINTDKDLFNGLLAWRSYSLTPPTVRKLMDLYPNDPCHEPPFDIGNCSVFPSKGLQWRRSAAIGGDMVMVSGRRRMCELYTSAGGQPVYSYRFDTRLWNKTGLEGVQHFDNVAYSFQNISGLLGPSPKYDAQRRLSRAVGESYVNFVNNFDPNGKGTQCRRGSAGLGNGTMTMPYWPKYDLARPQNLVFNATFGPFVEDDTFRREGIAFLNTFEVAREMLA